jgi:DNA-binding MarR family transcriptional regulator
VSDAPPDPPGRQPAPHEAPLSRERAALLVQRLELAGQYQRAARARQRGMPHIEVAALEHLVVVGALTPGALVHRLGLTSGGVTALTTRLHEAGLVTRERHPTDRRMRVVTATEAGKALLADYLAPILAPTAQAVSWLSDSDITALERAIGALVTSKERAAADTPAASQTDDATYTPDLLM